MAKSKPQIVICTYRVKPGKHAAFARLLRRHWPTLNRLGAVAKTPRMAFRGIGDSSKDDVIEIFAWKAKGLEIARSSPEVLAIWEPMELLCEARNGRPAMEFPHYEEVSVK